MTTSVNNKCRSFTSMEQSKKLSKILPIETADAYYWLAWRGGISEEKKNTPFAGTPKKDAVRVYWCPYWSLAALLNDIPQAKLDSIIQYDKKYWRCCAYFASYWYHSDWTDNPVNACYEMILKLHELKKL